MLHGKPSAVTKRCFVQLPMETTQWKEGADTSASGAFWRMILEKAVKASEATAFCQISHFFNGCLLGFVKSGVKPTQKFPGQLHAWKFLRFEFRYKPVVLALCWVH